MMMKIWIGLECFLYYLYSQEVKIMNNFSLLERITINPAIFGGKPIIRGLRISVEMILDLLSQGVSREELLEDYPDLEPEDLQACLTYAKTVIANEEIENVVFQEA